MIMNIAAKKLFRAMAVCAVLSAFCSCISEKSTVFVSEGDKLPDFSVVMDNGQVVSNDSLKGSFSLIMFFHTTCGDCRQTLPIIQQAYETWPQVRFVLISRAQTADSLKTYWQRNGLTLPYSAQSDRKVYEKFATSVVPRVYLCDPETVVRKAYDDQVAAHAQTILDDLRQLLAEGK